MSFQTFSSIINYALNLPTVGMFFAVKPWDWVNENDSWLKSKQILLAIIKTFINLSTGIPIIHFLSYNIGFIISNRKLRVREV